MADNITLNTGSGGSTLAADDIGSVWYQRIKITDGTADSTVALGIFAEDAAASAGDTGIQILAVRRDADTTLVGADNDYAPLQVNAAGALKVEVFDGGDSLTVDNAGLTELAAAINSSKLDVNLGTDNDVTVTNATATNLKAEVIGTGTFAVQIADTSFAVADGNALGEGVLVQGDDGTDRKNINVDATTGDVQVDVTNTVTVDLGANNDVSINSGSNTIGEVTIGTATTAATDLAKATDVAAGANDVGIAPLAIRDDSLSALTPVEGDYVPLRVGSTGALHVTGGGGGTEYTEDIATANPIVGTASMMERDDVLSALTPVAGDWASFRCSAEGALWVQEFNSDAILADTASMDTNLGTLAGAVTGTEFQVDVITMPTVTVTATNLDCQSGGADMATAAAQLADGHNVTIDNASGASAVNIQDGGNSITVDNAGTFAVQVVDTSFAVADGSALGEGVLVQGDDGTDRKNINVDATTGDVQVDITHTVVVSATNLDCQSGGADMATAAGQLADGHNVTIDNASGASAVNIQDGGNSITVDGSLTVDLGANNDVTVTNATATNLKAEVIGTGTFVTQATLAAETTKVIGSTITAAAATGGMSYDQLALAAEDNDKIIKASPGTLYFISVQSIDATPVYLKLFDATSITPGTTAANFQFMCPAAATAALGAGIVLNFSPGIQFGTGIVALISTGLALDANTAVSANEVVVTFGFE